jgi:hypothetical protein
MLVSTTQAAFLLNVSTSRIRQLLSEGRIFGAIKIGHFWQIPLFEGGKPKVSEGKAGPQNRWRLPGGGFQKAATRIHINKHKLDKNRNHNKIDPIIAVRRGSAKPEYCHTVEIKGPSKLVYRPEKPLNVCKSAVLWIEVDPTVEVVATKFAA